MIWADVFRTFVLLSFGVGVGFMVLTNWLAWRVLRSPSLTGFIWWHVTAISVSTFCLGSVAVDRVFQQLGNGPQWYMPVTFLGAVLFCVSQVIIYRIERRRAALVQAARESK